MPKKFLPIANRSDYSSLIVHLTRYSGGQSARNNLISILKSLTIRASGIHCLHKYKVEKYSEVIQKKFHVACFTEVPLDQMEELVGKIPGRSISLQPYGIVFRRQYLMERGAQPALYVNDYGTRSIRDAFDRLFDIESGDGFKGTAWQILPFVNIVNTKHDFSWEREWRFRGDFTFKASEIVCIILPSSEVDLRKQLNSLGVGCIEPTWSYEKIVLEMAEQVTTTAKQLREAL